MRDWLKLMLALFALFAIPASLQARVVAPSCHATSDREFALATIDWQCDETAYNQLAERVLLRFDLAPGAELPQHLTTRVGTYHSLITVAIDADGKTRTLEHRPADARVRADSPWISVPLPEITKTTRQVVVVIVEPWVASLAIHARLVVDPADAAWPLPTMLALAAICGVLFVPLVFDLVFYRVLRRRFLLWHSVVVVGMIVQTGITSGQIMAFLPLTALMLPPLYPLSLAISVAAAAMFSTGFFEDGMISDRTKAMLRVTAGFVVLFSVVYALKLPGTRTFASSAYYAAYIPVILVLAYAMYQALGRGSRAAWFQLAAWLPLFVIAMVRIGSNLGIGKEPEDAIIPFTIAIALEALITSAGVVDRFMILRRQRDRAEARADMMAAMSMTDALTGLANRRALEAEFSARRRMGFTSFALIDLDGFKYVNDTWGHKRGDEVLRAVGMALTSDDNMLTYRLGGEEFVVLLRGSDPCQRAELRRQAITTSVGKQLPDLEHVVTASMGLIELPRGADYRITFAEAYEAADRLLYEAKAAGRNRSVSQKITLFEREPVPFREQTA